MKNDWTSTNGDTELIQLLTQDHFKTVRTLIAYREHFVSVLLYNKVNNNYMSIEHNFFFTNVCDMIDLQ